MNLNANDGMSSGKSTHEERETVLDIIGLPFSEDCIVHGFYIGELSLTPVADYGGNMIKNEINENNLGLM